MPILGSVESAVLNLLCQWELGSSRVLIAETMKVVPVRFGYAALLRDIEALMRGMKVGAFSIALQVDLD